jgi:hypothetical protein
MASIVGARRPDLSAVHGPDVIVRGNAVNGNMAPTFEEELYGTFTRFFVFDLVCVGQTDRCYGDACKIFLSLIDLQAQLLNFKTTLHFVF